MKKAIESPDIPKAIGPYSAAITQGNMVFTAGQLGVDPKTGQFAGNSVEDQTKQALKNMGSILQAAGCTFDNVVKVTVFLADIAEFCCNERNLRVIFLPSLSRTQCVSSWRPSKKRPCRNRSNCNSGVVN
jgi:reactive intermediate/imine deaminase